MAEPVLDIKRRVAAFESAARAVDDHNSPHLQRFYELGEFLGPIAPLQSIAEAHQDLVEAVDPRGGVGRLPEGGLGDMARRDAVAARLAGVGLTIVPHEGQTMSLTTWERAKSDSPVAVCIDDGAAFAAFLGEASRLDQPLDVFRACVRNLVIGFVDQARDAFDENEVDDHVVQALVHGSAIASAMGRLGDPAHEATRRLKELALYADKRLAREYFVAKQLHLMGTPNVNIFRVEYSTLDLDFDWLNLRWNRMHRLIRDLPDRPEAHEFRRFLIRNAQEDLAATRDAWAMITPAPSLAHAERFEALFDVTAQALNSASTRFDTAEVSNQLSL